MGSNIRSGFICFSHHRRRRPRPTLGPMPGFSSGNGSGRGAGGSSFARIALSGSQVARIISRIIAPLPEIKRRNKMVVARERAAAPSGSGRNRAPAAAPLSAPRAPHRSIPACSCRPVIALPGMRSPDHAHQLVDQVDKSGTLGAGKVGGARRQDLPRVGGEGFRRRRMSAPVTWLCGALGRLGGGAVALVSAS
jgi:hypothetical protein